MEQIRILIKYNQNDFKREVTEMTSAFFSAFDLTFEKLETALDNLENGSSIPRFIVTVKSDWMEKTFCYEGEGQPEETHQLARKIKREIYKLYSDFSGKQLPWGTMTGIRPVKLYRRLFEENPETVKERLMEEYFVRGEKIDSLERIFHLENRYLTEKSENELSVYVGIPFCPSRCSYCSFSSVKAKEDRSDIKEYLKCLTAEIKGTVEGGMGERVQSIYIGGGTPGILEPEEIRELLEILRKAFPDVEEITFEGGRPDVLTREKLLAVYEAGSDRISINPQTMNDSILSSLNRSHTASDVKRVFAEAREIGIKNINMDLILGLPGETWQSFLSSLEAVISLDPESITIHALSLKKASEFMASGLKHLETEKPDIAEVIQARLSTAGYSPYYLYRQKNTYMNLENVGYAKDGFECVFNIQSMADKQSCIAFGADAVSKFVTENGLIRLHNPKFPAEYNEKIKEIVDKKRALL